jgi:hypothetical protein
MLEVGAMLPYCLKKIQSFSNGGLFCRNIRQSGEGFLTGIPVTLIYTEIIRVFSILELEST